MKVSEKLLQLERVTARLVFHKMRVLGQTVLVVDQRHADAEPFDPMSCPTLSDPQVGVGFDLLVTVEPAEHAADAKLRFWNRRGEEVGTQDNGARCAAQLLLQESGSDTVELSTPEGIFACGAVLGGGVWMDIGDPIFQWQGFPIDGGEAAEQPEMENDKEYIISLDVLFRSLSSSEVDDTGRFHGAPDSAVARGGRHVWGRGCVLLVDHFDIVERESVRNMILGNVFFSSGVPAWLAMIMGPNTVRMQFWNNGLRRGQPPSGVVAAAGLASAVKFRVTQRDVDVEFANDTVRVEWPKPSNEERTAVRISGPVSTIFSGETTTTVAWRDGQGGEDDG